MTKKNLNNFMIELLLLLLLLLIILLIYYLKSSREYLWGSIIRGPKIRWVILFPERSYWPISCGVLKKKRKEKHTYIGTLNFMHLSSFIRDHRLGDLTVWAHLARNVVENVHRNLTYQGWQKIWQERSGKTINLLF